jgi:hypothetical protein
MMAGLRRGGAWDSALSADGFAAIRTVGFEPVGQVFGAAVYYLSATAGVSCPGGARRYLLRDGPPEAPGSSATTVSGQGIPGPAGRVAQALYDGRRTAIDRMAGECADLGGHGIVGASLQVEEIPAAARHWPARSLPTCPARTSPSWSWSAGCLPGSRWASR